MKLDVLLKCTAQCVDIQGITDLKVASSNHSNNALKISHAMGKFLDIIYEQMTERKDGIAHFQNFRVFHS